MENVALLKDIRAFCSRAGMALTTFGLKAANDGKLVQRLEAGGECLPSTEARIRQFMDDPTTAFVPRRLRQKPERPPSRPAAHYRGDDERPPDGATPDTDPDRRASLGGLPPACQPESGCVVPQDGAA